MNKYELVYDLKEHLDTYSQTYDDYIMSYGEVDMIYHYIEEKDKEIEILKRRLEEYQEYVEINHKEIERLNNIINKALEKSKGLQYRFGYVLDDLIYLLMQGSDKNV